ncbi:hypothetical protein WJX81_007377 [Elliptochloris bilobata]|uniref:Phosphoglycerate mutase-like protein n=1 Tax=Elliptochloris bilobata TaxID=381761 RepID=A0AAW1S527_9CHLO
MVDTAQPHTKVVHFVRHGEGFHNVAGRADQANYLSREYYDAHLTENGWRALETAAGAFGGGEWRGQGNGPLLMAALESEPGKQAPHAAISAGGCPPFIAWEECREHLGRHPCDQRRALSHYKAAFPAVDFCLIKSEEDELWTPDTREGHAEIRARGAAFLRWLLARPEPRLAVVTHSSFLFFMLSTLGGQCDARIKGELHRWYENCEMRTVVLADASGASAGLDLNWFPGGPHPSRAAFGA